MAKMSGQQHRRLRCQAALGLARSCGSARGVRGPVRVALQRAASRRRAPSGALRYAPTSYSFSSYSVRDLGSKRGRHSCRADKPMFDRVPVVALTEPRIVLIEAISCRFGESERGGTAEQAEQPEQARSNRGRPTRSPSWATSPWEGKATAYERGRDIVNCAGRPRSSGTAHDRLACPSESSYAHISCPTPASVLECARTTRSPILAIDEDIQ